MDDPILQAVRAILELGWPAIVLVQSVILWRAHQTMVDRYIAYLETREEREPASDPRSQDITI